MAMPYSLHASITRSSLMDPPGCAMYFTPLLCALCTLSPNGKKASDPRATPSILSSHSLFSSLVKRLRLFGEELLPTARLPARLHNHRSCTHRLHCLCLVCPHLPCKRQVQYFWTLTKEPVVSFLPGQSGAVDPGLLSCSDTDSLAALDDSTRSWTACI